jgi:TonB family protein
LSSAKWFGGRAARQWSATPRTAVRIRSKPQRSLQTRSGGFFYALALPSKRSIARIGALKQQLSFMLMVMISMALSLFQWAKPKSLLIFLFLKFEQKMKHFFLIAAITFSLSSTAQQEKKAIELLGEGLQAMSAKEYEKADSLIALSIEMNEDGQSYFQRGNVQLLMADTCAACASYEKAITMNVSTAVDRFALTCVQVDTLNFPEDIDPKILKTASFSTVQKERCSDKQHQIFHLKVESEMVNQSLISFRIKDDSFAADSILSLENLDALPELGKVYSNTQTPPMIEETGRALSAMTILTHTMNTTKYPSSAKKSGAQGTVVVTFVVNEKGEKTDFEILQSVHPDLDKEAIRVASTLPEVGPATVGGKPVQLEYIMPVRFVLN